MSQFWLLIFSNKTIYLEKEYEGIDSRKVMRKETTASQAAGQFKKLSMEKISINLTIKVLWVLLVCLFVLVFLLLLLILRKGIPLAK